MLKSNFDFVCGKSKIYWALHCCSKFQTQFAPNFFLENRFLFLKNTNSQDVLKGLKSTEFHDILYTNKLPNKCSTDQLKTTFKHSNFVRKPF